MLKQQNISFGLVREFLDSLCLITNAEAGIERRESDISEQISAAINAESIKLLCIVAEDSRVPASILQMLASHPAWEVREAVCDNPSLPESVLRRMAYDEHPDVRYAIAENHQMPTVILDALCDDCNPYVSSRASQTIMRINQANGFDCVFSAGWEMNKSIQLKHTRLDSVAS